ncbi:YHS domain-containing (seleno)protein [Sneathiella chinensis]|uniref:YHS domain protein n=1 Tax=Sneathiella chinensis TaxID=349750 RepID=A0ABQ5U4C8_9PROT|nr:YHS domain-containing (seleno)protein [Sneathiella chinensis]GLQ06583.1 hypothetical protein GCM10007924_18040 [Sneathiella chinensis]
MQKLFPFLLSAMLCVISLPASAFDEINTGFLGNLALKGYDSVEYHSSARPVMGSPSLTVNWKGAVWRFASSANRDLFAADPERYAPQYGGYCSNQMSLGNLYDSDPAIWLIHKGKLYFFGHQAGKDRWTQTGIDARIEDADRHWQDYLTGAKG